MLGEETIGVIAARKSSPGDVVDDEDAQVLGLLATHAAVAVANARAYAHQREAASRAASRAAELEAVLESMTDGVLLVDEAGLVSSANSAAASILGRAPSDLAQALLPDVLPSLRSSDRGGEVEPPSPPEMVWRLRAGAGERELVGEVDGVERVLAVLAVPVGGESTSTLIVLAGRDRPPQLRGAGRAGREAAGAGSTGVRRRARRQQPVGGRSGAVGAGTTGGRAGPDRPDAAAGGAEPDRAGGRGRGAHGAADPGVRARRGRTARSPWWTWRSSRGTPSS